MADYERLLGTALLFVLTLLRCGGLVMYTPFFGSEIFPAQARVFLAGAFAWLLVPLAGETAVLPPQLDMPELAMLAAQEVSIGFVVGFLTSFVFLGAQLAGELAGQQIGLSMASVVDPSSDSESPLLGYLQMNLATAIFVTAKLHLVVAFIVWRSYEYVGIGTLLPEPFFAATSEAGLDRMEAMYVTAVQLGMPILMVMLMNAVVEGFITRTIPQMNIMVLGLPLRLVIGLGALVFLMPAMCMALLPPEWEFNLRSMPEGAFGETLEALAGYFQDLGARLAPGGEGQP